MLVHKFPNHFRQFARPAFHRLIRDPQRRLHDGNQVTQINRRGDQYEVAGCPPDGFFQFGYTESKITYAILKKALDNKDITRDGLLTAFESLNSVDLGGLLPPVTYGSSPNERVPTLDSIIFAIDPTQPTGVKPLSADFTGGAAQQSQF